MKIRGTKIGPLDQFVCRKLGDLGSSFYNFPHFTDHSLRTAPHCFQATVEYSCVDASHEMVHNLIWKTGSSNLLGQFVVRQEG